MQRIARPLRVLRLGTALLAAAVAAVLTVAAVLLVRGFLGDRPATASETAKEDNEKPSDHGQILFRDWKDPDFVLMLSGQQYGYLSPCGCSEPQKGGLERRYNLLKSLEGRGWPVVSLDLGDIPQKQGPAHLPNVQGLKKYYWSMAALKEMKYSAVGIGENETLLPLEVGLASYSLNEPEPRVVAGNLIAKGNIIPDNTTAKTFLAQVPNREKMIGVIGVVGNSVAKIVQNNNLSFESVKEALPNLIKEIDVLKPRLKVLLYQGSGDEAKALAKAFPQFQVILCLSDDDEPPAQPINAKDPITAKTTMIVTVGHKGKHIGVVGFFANAAAKSGFDLRYQMVTLDPDFATPVDQRAAHPIMKIMELHAGVEE